MDKPPGSGEQPSAPEPDPITISEATFDRSRRFLDAVASGTFDRSELSKKLDDFLPIDVFDRAAEMIADLGPPLSMFAFAEWKTAECLTTYFRVRYSDKTLTWAVGLDPDDRITTLSLRHNSRNKIFNVSWQNISYEF